ncbi:hypothetical protein O1L44_26305 [Streptomyces noursei]|nr:hypothetical protein [Streptomyces noursei]
MPFARGVHTAIADLVTDAEPLSEVRLTRGTSSRRHRYEQLAHWPSGFLALGGAVASVNPDYGQGCRSPPMAPPLRAALRRYGLDDPTLARRVQRTVGGLVEAPWVLATGAEPVPSPRPGAPRTSLAIRVVRGAMSGLRTPAAGLPPVCRAYVDVVTPAVPVARLPRPFTPPAASAVRSPDLDTLDSTDAPSDLPSLFTAPPRRSPCHRPRPRLPALGPAPTSSGLPAGCPAPRLRPGVAAAASAQRRQAEPDGA